MLERCDKIMHLHFNFDACPNALTLQVRALDAWNVRVHYFVTLAKVNMQLLIYMN